MLHRLFEHSENADALLKALLAVLVWGTSCIAVGIELRDVSPPTLIWFRFAIGLLIVRGLVRLRPGGLSRHSHRAELGVIHDSLTQSSPETFPPGHNVLRHAHGVTTCLDPVLLDERNC